jgi:hypothetical protein
MTEPVSELLRKYKNRYIAIQKPQLLILTIPIQFIQYERTDFGYLLDKKETERREGKQPILKASEAIMRALNDIASPVCRSAVNPEYLDHAGNYFEIDGKNSAPIGEHGHLVGPYGHPIPHNHMKILDAECPGYNVFLTLFFTQNTRVTLGHSRLQDLVLAFMKKFNGIQGIKLESFNMPPPPPRQLPSFTQPLLISFSLWSIHHYILPDLNSSLWEQRKKADKYALSELKRTKQQEITQEDLEEFKEFETRNMFNPLPVMKYNAKSGIIIEDDEKNLCKKPSELIALCVSKDAKGFKNFAQFVMLYYWLSLLKMDEKYNQNGYILSVVPAERQLPSSQAMQLYLKLGYRIIDVKNESNQPYINANDQFYTYYMYRGPITRSEIQQKIVELERSTAPPQSQHEFFTFLIQELNRM